MFDQEISAFVWTEILGRQIQEEFLNKLYSLDTQDDYYEAKKIHWKFKKEKELDAVFSMKRSKQRSIKKIQ